jgi:hypothetical protein
MNPLLLHPFPIQHLFEGCRGLFCMTPGLIDQNNHLADFHIRFDLIARNVAKAGGEFTFFR